MFSVKSGQVSVGDIRDLRGVIEREDAVIGVLLTLNEFTRPMKEEAASAGVYESAGLRNRTYPRIQIRTIEELLDGHRIDAPIYAQGQENVTLQSHAVPPADKGQDQEEEDTQQLNLLYF